MNTHVPSIYIEVPDYNLSKHDSDIFVGREEALLSLVNRIEPSENQKDYKGAYLVSGYRGMGKSTLVKRAYEKVNKKHRKNLFIRIINFIFFPTYTTHIKVVDTTIFLSQQNLSDYDFLRQLFLQFKSNTEELWNFKFWLFVRRFLSSNLILSLAFIGIIFGCFSKNKDSFEKIIKGNHGYSSGISISVFHITIFEVKPTGIPPSNQITWQNSTAFFAFTIAVSLILLRIILLKIFLLIFSKTERFYKSVKEINSRINANVEVALSNNQGYSPMGIVGGMSGIKSMVNLINPEQSKTSKQVYQRITTKELDFKIGRLLELVKGNAVFNPYRFLFIVDELDKIEPEFVKKDATYFELGKTIADNRRETMAKLLANIKSFINTVNAKFVFIGGADMYDSSLADVADRESFYSSIFHEVIYVDSFFKDFERNTGSTKKSLIQMTESYLYRILLGSKAQKDLQSPYLTHYLQILSKNKGRARDKDRDKVKLGRIALQLYRFAYYLTFRSNGSPKRLKELLEYYMATEKIMPSDAEYLKKDPGSYFKIEGKRLDPNDIVITAKPRKQENYDPFKNNREFSYPKLEIVDHTDQSVAKKWINKSVPRTFIRLDYREQYKIGATSMFMQPFVRSKGNHLKLYNDKNLYLLAYLTDHLLKFHKSAFSWREIELMPDIIMGNIGPNLRSSLRDLLDYMTIAHLRKTTNAMFQYKFRSRFAMELRYLSKISEISAAAFNFTYNESDQLKTFFKRKLKQKIDSISSNRSLAHDTSFIHTLASLNATIAVIYYYDEEYYSARRYYSDSIQALRDLQSHQHKELTNHQKFLYTRNRLFLSLCQEKSFAYASAYSTIRGITTESKFFSFPNTKPKKKKKKQVGYSNDKSLNGPVQQDWEDPYKRIQLFLRPHLVLLMIIEKDRSDGITYSNLKRNIEEYGQFMGLKKLFPNSEFDSSRTFRDFFITPYKGDDKRVQTLLLDYYQTTGAILFLKNRNFKSLHHKGAIGIWHSFMGIKSLQLQEELKGRDIHPNIDDESNRAYDKSINLQSLDNIRQYLEDKEKEIFDFYPSYSATYYYLTALGHLLSPYIENILSIGVYENGRWKGGKDSFNDLLLSTIRLETEPEERKSENTSYKIYNPFALVELLFQKQYKHVLNGKQYELLGLLLSKLSDSILGSITSVQKLASIDLDEKIGIRQLNQNFWGLYGLTREEKLVDPDLTWTDLEGNKKYVQEFNCQIHFDCFFSINNVFYLNLLSSLAYKKGGLLYDSLFSLKKCLYILRTIEPTNFKSAANNIEKNRTTILHFTSKIEEKIKEILPRLETFKKHERITLSDYSRRRNTKISESNEPLFTLPDDYFDSSEQEEVEYLVNQIRICWLDTNKGLELNTLLYENGLDYSNPINHVFTWLQKLRLCSKVIYRKNKSVFINLHPNEEHNKNDGQRPRLGKEIIESEEIRDLFVQDVEQLEKLFRNILNIVKTYGVNYILSYAYLANIYKDLGTITKAVLYYNQFYTDKEIKWEWGTSEKYAELLHKELECYQKALRLHSEGPEYKSQIKELYLLEDDLNDSLIHFYAALERSLINRGIIHQRVQTVKDKIKKINENPIN